MTYDQALEDWIFLFEDINPAVDMTGGYVDQRDLDSLLKSPTKTTAKKCLCAQIEYWFQVGPDDGRCGISRIEETLKKHPESREIAERHGLI